MSANPFSTENLVPNWAQASEILKGGPGSGAQEGHPFEGNQFVHDASNLSSRASAVRNGGSAGVASEHSLIGAGHREVAKAIEDGMRSGKIPASRWGAARQAIEAHLKASEEHGKASSAAAKVAQLEIKPATGSKIAQTRMAVMTGASGLASQVAEAASKNAENLTRAI
jgi:hypothetical protein